MGVSYRNHVEGLSREENIFNLNSTASLCLFSY